MFKSIKMVFVVAVIVLLSSCSINPDCKCDVPGAALVKVFIAEDGIPNVNINAIEVYPGQKLVFDGLDEFSLTFARDPQDPSVKQKTYKSKKGKIVLKISDVYDDILKNQRNQKGFEIVQGRETSADTDASRYLFIKYDVTAGGKTRDPGLKIFPK